jgi:hypothetical protein
MMEGNPSMLRAMSDGGRKTGIDRPTLLRGATGRTRPQPEAGGAAGRFRVRTMAPLRRVVLAAT